MALKDILKGKSEDKKEYFWALTIEPGWVQAGVWRVHDGKTQIVSTSPPAPWELEEELIEAVDTALSASIKDFPEEAEEPNKAVFGVVGSWVSQGDIKQEYLEKIKKICSKLTLTPLGFVVLPEAIAHYVKSEEGSPISAVVLGISKNDIEISVFRLGKLSGSYRVARSLSIVDDTVEGLTRFASQDPFPSRFLLYDGRKSEIEEVRQELLRANWDDYPKVAFLHTPKIETISSKIKVHAVALAGASELADVTSVYAMKETKEEKESSADLPAGRAGKARASEDKDEDKELENVAEVDRPVSPEEFGFALEEDVAVSSKKVGQEFEKESTQPPERPSKVEESKRKLLGKRHISGFLEGFKDRLSGFSVMKFVPSVSIGRRTLVVGVSFFAVVIVSIFTLWWFYPKVTVTIYVSTKKLEEKVDITIDPSVTSPDISSRVLPGNVLATSVSGDRTKSTTGTKTVGDKAKGEVTLYRVGSQLSLASGTLISGPDNLRFSLDESATVASGSAGTPGTTKAKVTAADIGAQYNLAGGATFGVGNYSISDIEAKSESSFSGGSSREISAVSAKDQEILEDELTEELKEKARLDLLEKISEDEIFIDDSLSATASSRTFSDKVGDETESLKLSLSLDTQAITVDKNALFNLSKEILRDKIPEGFVLRSEQIDASFEYEREIAGTFVLSVDVSVNLLPEIDPGQVATKIAGKYPPLVQDYLINEVPGFSRAEISFNKPRFPGKLGTLPWIVKNIEVVIAAEK
ncbi:hypothetical protein IID22_00280 [Patescibacteria group bacterium]|nr:hypothetical protein [Patescibacteria group bacterium]